jgi:hypothetical protein
MAPGSSAKADTVSGWRMIGKKLDNGAGWAAAMGCAPAATPAQATAPMPRKTVRRVGRGEIVPSSKSWSPYSLPMVQNPGRFGRCGVGLYRGKSIMFCFMISLLSADIDYLQRCGLSLRSGDF